MIKKICFYIFLFFCLILNIVLDINIKNYISILNICFEKDIMDILLVLFQKENENKGINFKTEDGTYGTSNWMNETELKEVLGINDVPGIILGKLNGDIIKLPFDSYFNKNIAIFGSSR